MYFKFTMNSFVFICAALIAASVNASPLDKKLGSKIVGGEDANIEDHPYQVSLEYYGLHICGGTFIKEEFIITAAHCVHEINPNKLYVRLGTIDRNKGGIVIKVKEIIKHDDFDPVTINYDVAVLILNNKVPEDNVAKEIDSLATEMLKIEGEGTVTGWGHTAEGGELAEKLQSVVVPVFEPEKCKEFYGDAIKESMFCAGPPEGGKDACLGDSGSPFVQPNSDIAGKRLLVGIVSWGEGCGQTDKPRVYTSIPMVEVWLRNVIGNGAMD